MNATKQQNGDVTASASRAEGFADSSIRDLRRRSQLGRISSERPTGSVTKRTRDWFSVAASKAIQSSPRRPGAARSALRDRVSVRESGQRRPPSSRGLGYSAVPPEAARRKAARSSSSGTIVASPSSRPEDWRLGQRLDLERAHVSIPEAGRCVETFDEGAASRVTHAEPEASGSP